MPNKQRNHFINGKWLSGHGDEFSSLDPVFGEMLWHGREATQKDVDAAVSAAQMAFKFWSQKSFDERSEFVREFAKRLEMHKQDLTLLIAKESGKPLWEAATEVASMIGKVAISIDAFKKRTSEISHDMPAKRSLTRFCPHGPVAVFGPYNFPGHLANGHIVPALLAGNTVVFKPSELTPAVAQKTVEIWAEAGLPDGVINLVQGAKITGQSIVQNHALRGLFFTGSSTTGKILSKAFAERPQVILALEMGGNNPLVVTNVKDVRAASYLTIQSAYITAGQRCSCARRLIVPEDKSGDEFIARLIADIKHIKVGSYQDIPEPFMGSMITHKAAKKVLSEQDKLAKSGAMVLVKSELLKDKTGLISPSLLDVTSVKKKEDQEIFGPLLQLCRVKNFEEAVAEASNTAYGLAAGLISDDRSQYEFFYRNTRAGVINWNNQLTGASSAAPFGGVGLSGNHRPSAYFAADYCSYPVASLENDLPMMPEKISPGLAFL